MTALLLNVIAAGLLSLSCASQQDVTPAQAQPGTAPAAPAAPGAPSAPKLADADDGDEERTTRRALPTPVELPAELPPDVRAILQSSWDAVGGPNPLARFTSLQFSVTMLGDATLGFGVRAGPQGQFALRQSQPGGTAVLEKWWDGRIAWIKDPRTGAFRLVDPKEVLRHRILLDMPNVFSKALTMGGLAWEVREAEEYAGRPVHVVRIWQAGGDWIELLISQQDKIPLATRYYSEGAKKVTRTSEWLELTRIGGSAGFLMPLRTVTRTQAGQNDLVFSEVHVDHLSPADFEAPLEVRDMAAAAERAKAAAGGSPGLP